MDAKLLPQSHQYPNHSEGADRVAGQLRGDKVPLQWRTSLNLAEFGGRCRKAMLGVCFSADSYGVRTAPVCNGMLQDLSAR